MDRRTEWDGEQKTLYSSPDRGSHNNEKEGRHGISKTVVSLRTLSKGTVRDILLVLLYAPFASSRLPCTPPPWFLSRATTTFYLLRDSHTSWPTTGWKFHAIVVTIRSKKKLIVRRSFATRKQRRRVRDGGPAGPRERERGLSTGGDNVRRTGLSRWFLRPVKSTRRVSARFLSRLMKRKKAARLPH